MKAAPTYFHRIDTNYKVLTILQPHLEKDNHCLVEFVIGEILS